VYACPTGEVTRDARPIDAEVEQVVLDRLKRPDALDLFQKPDVDVDSLRNDALVVRARLDELASAYAEGDIDLKQLRDGSRRLRDRLDGIEQSLSDAASGTVLDGLTGADVDQAWGRLDLDRKRAVVAALLTIIINPARRGRQPGGGYHDDDSVTIDWRQP
jgi:hypothetical protein